MSPLEQALVNSLRYRLKANEFRDQARKADDPQQKLFFEKQEQTQRTYEEYHLGHALDYAMLLLDAEPAEAVAA